MGATTARYDTHADWYDHWSETTAAPVMAAARASLLELLPDGTGLAVDLGCGTGLPGAAVGATGRPVVGIDVSADQLRHAAGRLTAVAVGDATRVPLRDGIADVAYSVLTHTDVDDFAAVVGEAVRILVPGGVFVYVGVHPCFNNSVAEPTSDGVVVHAGYREAGRRPPSRYRTGGVTQRVGVHHLPLADLLAAFLRPDAVVDRVVERGDGPVPPLLGIRLRATKSVGVSRSGGG